MPMTPAGLTMLREQEGLRLRAYRDINGHLTIGYGHNLEVGSISTDAARQILADDLELTEIQVSNRIRWLPSLSPPRRDVLINMAFNLGIDGLLEFHQLLFDLIHEDWNGAASAMLESRWAGQVPSRAKALAEIMRNG